MEGVLKLCCLVVHKKKTQSAQRKTKKKTKKQRHFITVNGSWPIIMRFHMDRNSAVDPLSRAR
jgi:hypothetical protein